MYLEMGDEEKTDIKLITKRLREAFSDNQFMAYGRLREARWTGESVDVFANELRRLARLCGLTGEGLEQIVKLGFVTGFPDSVALELQQVVGVEGMKVADLIGRARILASNKGSVGFAAPAVDQASRSSNSVRKTKGCFRCGGPHFARECQERKRPTVCFRCGGEGHIAVYCEQGNRGTSTQGGGHSMTDNNNSNGAACASGCPRSAGGVRGVPVIKVCVGGRSLSALVDTGCSNTMIRSRFVDQWTGKVHTKAFDGRTVKCKGTACIELEVAGEKVSTAATVLDEIIGSIDVVLGMDVIDKLGGVAVGDKTVQFGRVACTVVEGYETKGEKQTPTEIVIQDKDFEAKFDGKIWTVRYFWKSAQAPRLKNKVSMYNNGLQGAKKECFDKEVEK